MLALVGISLLCLIDRLLATKTGQVPRKVTPLLPDSGSAWINTSPSRFDFPSSTDRKSSAVRHAQGRATECSFALPLHCSRSTLVWTANPVRTSRPVGRDDVLGHA